MINEGYLRAQRWFAAANGWRVANRGFSLATLARNGMHGSYLNYIPDHGGYWDNSVVDHAEFFRKDRRAVAIVGHNYDGTSIHYGTEIIARIAADYGLVVHVAPSGKTASWYNPGGTMPLVITRPGIAIVWPTDEQMKATAQADAEYEIKSRELWEANKKRWGTG